MRLPEGAITSQLVALPTHRCLAYRASLLVQASTSQAEIEVSIRRTDKPTVILAHRIGIHSSDWQHARFDVQLPTGSAERGEALSFQIVSLKGSASVSNVELFPVDAIDGMDPDVIRASKDLRIKLLRWPGGNFASGYHWRNGVGPRDRRPTMPNPAWSGLETHHFGTDEFMRFCRHIRAEPMICVNAGDGTPEEAAAWVQYCNGPADSPMGRIRASNGHPEPYNVRVWEIGNELYGDWQIGHTDPLRNASRFVEFRRAMLASDPTIEIVATGKGDEFVAPGVRACDRWNRELLGAARTAGRPPDHISIHPLVPLPGGLAGKFSYERIYNSVMAHPHWLSTTRLPDMERQLRPSKIAITEWGIIHGGPAWLRYPNHDAQAGAVYAALLFHAMFRCASSIGISNTTALMHGGGIRRQNAVVTLLPMYHVMKMYGKARPRRLLSTHVEGQAYDSPETGFLPASDGVPYLDAVAAEGDGGSYLCVVNRDSKRARKAQLILSRASEHVVIETLSGEPQQRNTFEQPHAIAPRTASVNVGGGRLEHQFPPCSVTLIRW